MQVQSVNNHAVRKYEQFATAMGQVMAALESLGDLLKKAEMPDKRFQSGTLATPEELQDMHRHAGEQLETLRNAAKKYEAELMSRGWRV